MQFIYAISGLSTVSQKALNDAGLSYLKPCGDYLQVSSQIGPEQGRCVLFWADKDNSRELRYNPMAQIWTKSLNGKFHIGYYADNPPAETDLRRHVLANHYNVRLNDEETWCIPVVRIYNGKTVLDEVMTLDPNGQIVYSPQKRYEELCAKVSSLWDDIAVETGINPGPFKLDDKQRYELAAEILQMNYIIGKDEIGILKLFTKNNISEIFRAVLDIPFLEKAMEMLDSEVKKKAVI